MSITRINEFHAREGSEADLKIFLTSLIPHIKGAEGCESCVVLQSETENRRFLVVEVWKDKVAHENSVKKIPVGDIQQIVPLLVAPPEGDYYLS